MLAHGMRQDVLPGVGHHGLLKAQQWEMRFCFPGRDLGSNSDAVTCGRALFRSAVKFCVGLLKPKPCGGFSTASWRVGGGVALTFCLPFEEKNEEKIVA